METLVDDVVERIETAQKAFETARTATPNERASWLEAVADGVEAASPELVKVAMDETHLLEGRLTGEAVRTIFQLRLLADEVRRGANLGATIDHADPGWGMGPRPDLRRMNEPLGVVAVFGASNFPFAFSVIGGDSASGLAAGCAVVHKAHSAHERLAARTAEVVIASLADAGAPHGLFSVVFGRAAGQTVVDHPLIQAVGFTGSTAGGRALFDRAAARPEPIPFFGELGSTNPVFVTKRAWADRREQILTEYVGSVALGMGQFCTKPGFIVVPRSARDEIEGPIASAARAVTSHPMLSPHLRASFAGALDDLSERPEFDPIVEGDNSDEPAVTILHTTSDVIFTEPGLLEHEMFGPASVLVEYGDESELERLAELAAGQLTMSIQANADEDVEALVSAMQARSGRVLWNGWPTGVTVSYAQQHGGPYPATTASGTTSVGTAAIGRFMRPVSYQGFPPNQLPAALQDSNPWSVPQRVDGVWIESVVRQRADA